MKWPTYPKYKDSGVDLLGMVPEEWEVVPLKRQASLRIEKAEQRLSYSIALENIESWTGKYIETDSEFESNGTLFFIGDILFGKLRPYLAKVFLAPEDGEAVGDFHVIASKKSLKSEFLQYQLLTRGMIDIIDGSTFGAKMPRASWEFIGSLPIAVPSIPEQKSISVFLSQKLAEIDDLIAEQEKLIALLQEKRQAVISHAVTKGLNPDAPMKDSGVEWFGRVPERWTIFRLGNLCKKIGSGKTPSGGSEVYTDSGVLFIRSQNVYDEGLILDEIAHIADDTDKDMSNSHVVPGDILLNITGASLGRTCIVPDKFMPANVNQHVCIIRLTDASLRNYISYAMKSLSIKAQIDYSQNGAAREGMNFKQIANLLVTIPDIDEQQTIIAYIDREIQKIDKLIACSNNAIALLHERRTALISAAVTGKIDVRGLTASEPA